MAEEEVKKLRKNSPDPEVLATMRAEYAAGMSLNEVARRNGVCRRTVQDWAKRENWKQDADLAVQQRLLEKLAGISADDDAVKRDEAVDAAAQKLANVTMRHQREWEQIAAMRQQALQKRNTDPARCFDDLRIAKIAAEVTEIQQRGEAKVLGLYSRVKGTAAESSAVLVIERS